MTYDKVIHNKVTGILVTGNMAKGITRAYNKVAGNTDTCNIGKHGVMIGCTMTDYTMTGSDSQTIRISNLSWNLCWDLKGV